MVISLEVPGKIMMMRTQQWFAAAIVVGALVESGCTAEKARALRTAAVQFQVEANAAIDAIETVLVREKEPAPRSRAVADAEFVQNLLELSDDEELSQDDLELALDPFTVAEDPEVAELREALLTTLRGQYAAFADAFEDVERGSFFARDAVKEAAPYVAKLAVQMAGLADRWSKAPPRLLQRRTALLEQFDGVRTSNKLNDDQKRMELLKLKERWLELRREEQQLQQMVMERCLKTAKLGLEVRRLIDVYDKVSLEDLHSIIAQVLGATGALAGRDVSELKSHSEEVMNTIRSDPILSDLADMAIGEVNKAISSGGT